MNPPTGSWHSPFSNCNLNAEDLVREMALNAVSKIFMVSFLSDELADVAMGPEGIAMSAPSLQFRSVMPSPAPLGWHPLPGCLARGTHQRSRRGGPRSDRRDAGGLPRLQLPKAPEHGRGGNPGPRCLRPPFRQHPADLQSDTCALRGLLVIEPSEVFVRDGPAVTRRIPAAAARGTCRRSSLAPLSLGKTVGMLGAVAFVEDVVGLDNSILWELRQIRRISQDVSDILGLLPPCLHEPASDSKQSSQLIDS